MKSRFQYIISLSENKQVLTKCHFTLKLLADNTLGYLNTAKDENSQSIATNSDSHPPIHKLSVERRWSIW